MVGLFVSGVVGLLVLGSLVIADAAAHIWKYANRLAKSIASVSDYTECGFGLVASIVPSLSDPATVTERLRVRRQGLSVHRFPQHSGSTSSARFTSEVSTTERPWASGSRFEDRLRSKHVLEPDRRRDQARSLAF